MLVLGVPVGLALALVSPASADSARCTPGCAGYAYFVSYGDHLWVEDRAADGHSAVAYYQRHDTGARGYLWNPYGAWNRPVERNFNLIEHTGFTYQVCLGEYGSRTIWWNTCSDPITDHA
jgi:hypothetical protein